MKRSTYLLPILFLLVFHGSLLAQISVVGSVSVSSRIAIDAVGTVAYAVGNNTLVTINLTNPATPTIMGQASVGEVSLTSVDVAANYAYCAGGSAGLVIVRVVDPTTPTWVHNFDMPAPVIAVDAYDTLVAVATGGNISLVGCRSRGNPHVLATYGHTASSIKMDYPARQIYAGSTGGAFSLNINVIISGSDTTFTLTARNQYGVGNCSPVGLSQPYVDIARGTTLTMATSTDLAEVGQYSGSGPIESVVAGPGCAFIGVSPAIVQFLDQRTTTPIFVGSVTVQAPPTGLVMAQAGGLNLVVVAHSLGVAVLSYSPLAVSPESGHPELPSDISMSAFPNPFNGETRLQLSAERAGSYTLRVFDILGRQVSSRALWFAGARTQSLDFSSFGAGTYIAEIGNGSTSARIKLLYVP